MVLFSKDRRRKKCGDSYISLSNRLRFGLLKEDIDYDRAIVIVRQMILCK